MAKSLVVNLDKCTGCRTCEMACSFMHYGEYNPVKSAVQVSIFTESAFFVPVVCFQCKKPFCEEVCPTGAARIDRSVPVVRIDEEECIGCGECIKACPFGAADLDENKEVAYICDLCDGEPVCVTHCICGALTYEPVQRLAQRKRRRTAEGHAGGEATP